MLSRTVILHLSLIENIGPATIQRIIEYCSRNEHTDIYWLSPLQLIQNFRCSERVAAILFDGLINKTVLEKELEYIEKYQVRWTTLLDAEYPTHLKEIYQPPAVLYWWGADLSITKQSIALVGSRTANQYGSAAIDALVPPLVHAGFATVSGGALGADTMVHKATMRVDGITVVVLGSGLLQPYPHSNKQLFREAAASGIVLSIFPLMSQPLPGNFPARNRVISGLSRGCVVVQAAEKSGALITAHYALEQGREVFAVPGIFNDPYSQGCHTLIRQGAQLVTSAGHILQELGYAAHTVEPIPAVVPQKELPEIVQFDIDNHQIANALVQACKEPCSFDELITLLPTYDATILQRELFNLSMQGILIQDFMGKWSHT
jgi:DNA processing protein